MCKRVMIYLLSYRKWNAISIKGEYIGSGVKLIRTRCVCVLLVVIIGPC